MTRLSVIVPWADRPELADTLRHNAAQFRRIGAEVVIVCCGGDPELLASCVSSAGSVDLCTIRLATSFNKALALNVGAHHASGETLFFLDSDLLLDDDACSTALARMANDCVVTLARVVESVPARAPELPYLKTIRHVLEIEANDGKIVRVETNSKNVAEASRSAPGMVFVRKRHFEQVGGMNSDLTGWGFEDLDLLIRLQLSAGVSVAQAGRAVHLSHGDDRRCIDGASRSANEAHNTALCLANYGLGYYFGTYEDDVASWTTLPEDGRTVSR